MKWSEASHSPWPRVVPCLSGFLKGAGFTGLVRLRRAVPLPGLTSSGAEECGGTGAAHDTGGQVISPTPLTAPRSKVPLSSNTYMDAHRSPVIPLPPQTDLAQPAMVSACAWKARPLPGFYQMGCRGRGWGGHVLPLA